MNILRYTLLIWISITSVKSQNQNSVIDSVNVRLESMNKMVDLSFLGNAEISLKDDVKLINCIIKEVHEHYLVYYKRKTMHDVLIDNIEEVIFIKTQLKLEFDSRHRGKISKKSNY